MHAFGPAGGIRIGAQFAMGKCCVHVQNLIRGSHPAPDGWGITPYPICHKLVKGGCSQSCKKRPRRGMVDAADYLVHPLCMYVYVMYVCMYV